MTLKTRIEKAQRRRAKHPLRQVVYIAEREGPRGGRYWMLTLECGHLATRDIPSPKCVVRSLMQGNVPSFAPEKVKCIICKRL